MTEIEARAARDQALAETDKYMLPDYPITPAGRLNLRAYRQALRDWPETAGFPDSAMPQPENWAAYKTVLTPSITPPEL